MDRNYAFVRSVIFSVITKVFGSFVVFGILPLAALSLNTVEYAMFNFSITIAGLFTIWFTPLSFLLVNKFARLASVADNDSVRKLAESSIAIYIVLGALLLPLALAASVYLAQPEFRWSIALAVAAALTTVVFSWADAFRLGHRRDHISSIFGLANNISIILAVVTLYHYGMLSYISLIVICSFLPLFWGLFSFVQVVSSRRLPVRFTPSLHDCAQAFFESTPLVGGAMSDYIRLYVSAFVAFYLADAQAYGVYSTVILLIARLTNPISLLSRPLIPAYVDAISRGDYRWIAMFRHVMVAIAVLSIGVTIAVSLTAAMYPLSEILHWGDRD